VARSKNFNKSRDHHKSLSQSGMPPRNSLSGPKLPAAFRQTRTPLEREVERLFRRNNALLGPQTHGPGKRKKKK